MASRRIVVFPVNGRRWAFGIATPLPSSVSPASSQPTFLQVWFQTCKEIQSGKGFVQSLSSLSQYVSDKMEQQWIALGASKEGSIKKRLHSVGEKLVARITPSETFLKLIPKEATKLEIVFPPSLNSRLVRRRVRHIAKSGAQIHSRYMYGSFACLPFSVLFGIVPVPNAPLFWNLFRAYANWHALQGSRRLLDFVSNDSRLVLVNQSEVKEENTQLQQQMVLCPSKLLESMLQHSIDDTNKVTDTAITRICEHYCLDPSQIAKWRDFEWRKQKTAL